MGSSRRAAERITAWSQPSQAQPRKIRDPRLTGVGQGVRVQGYFLEARKERGNMANCRFEKYVDWHLMIGSTPDTAGRCSMLATTSAFRSESPEFCISTVTAIDIALREYCCARCSF